MADYSQNLQTGMVPGRLPVQACCSGCLGMSLVESVPPQEVSDSRACTYLAKRLEQVVRMRLDQVLKPWRITALQYTALTVLDRGREGSMTSAALARRTFVTAQSMFDLVSAMEGRGWIQRTPDPEHKRRKLITLTPVGLTLLSEVAGVVGRVEQVMLTDLSETERVQFRRMLDLTYGALAAPNPVWDD